MKKKLKELATLVNGYAFKSINYCDTGIRIIRIANVKDGYVSDESPCYYPLEFEQKLGSAMLKENDLLMSLTGNVGRVALLAKNFLPAGLNQRVECIRPYDNDMTEYLFYYFRSKIFVDEVTSATTGCAQQNLSIKWLENHPIPIYCIKQRTDIVNELKKLDKVIDIKRQQLTSLNNLVKSRFIEMFGTFPNNEKSWETGTIRDIVTDVRYGTSRKAAEGNTGKYRYLRMNNITYDGHLDLSNIKTIDIPENEVEKCSVKYGDILFNRTNSCELVGKTCVYNRTEMMILAGFIIRVRVNERIRPEFLAAFLNTDFSKQMLLGMCKKAIGQANINAQEMQNIGIYIPPIELQNEFVNFVKQIDKSKFVYLFNPNIFYGSFSRFHHLP